MSNNASTPITAPDPVAQCILNCKDEAENARRNRYLQNRENYEVYHLRQDWSHKKRGQSKEFLAKQSIAVEQLCASLQQGLMDLGDWFRIDLQPGLDPTQVKISPKTIEKLLLRQLEKNKFPNFFNDTLKFGALGSLMVVKVGGKYVKRSTFEARENFNEIGSKKSNLIRKEKEVWQLDLNLIRQEDYYPDPTADGLYEIQSIEMDWFELKALAERYPNDFNMEAVDNIAFSVDDLQKAKKSRETGQNITMSQFRKRVTILEYWGTIIEQNTGKVLHENVVTAIDLQGNVIRPPKKNPYWHNSSPFITSPIIRVPLSVWHKALMDAPTRHNIAMNELYNLQVDAAMMEVHGIKQIRTNWLENSNQVSEGIAPGTTLQVNSTCPPGAKVLERVDTSAMTPQSMNMLELIDREFQQSAMTNDTRLGAVPQRAVKATEVVASNQALTGIMNGIVKVIEEELVSPILDKSWLTMAQHMNDLDTDEVKALVGEDQGRLVSSMAPEEIFATTALGHIYKVFGLSATLNKIQDFRKIQALLQSIGASPQMMQEFTRKYSMTKLLGEILKSLDIDDEKLIASPEEQQQRQAEMQMQAQAEAQQNGQGNTQGGQGTNPQSQIPQVANSSNEANPVAIQRGANNIGMTHP
jgi:hypothetical protein